MQRRPEFSSHDPADIDDGDGRHIDQRRGALTGEAADTRVERPAASFPTEQVDARPTQDRSNDYGLPPLKAPVWKDYIPAYDYIGGVTGAAAVLGAAATGWGRDVDDLVGKARWIATVGSGISAALLIADLGRPERFLNMLRVFRPRSPMNLGTWIVASTGTFSGASALFDPSRLGNAAGWMTGLSGLPMTGYTAVLLGNSAVPVWKDARRALPWLFVASAASSAGAVLEFLGSKTLRGRTMVRRFSLAGRIGEIAAAEGTQRELGHGVVREALDTGRPGRLWKASKALGWAGLLVSLPPKPSRNRQLLGAALTTACALAMRFALAKAGEASARDPRATFIPQRDRLEDRRVAEQQRERTRASQPTVQAEPQHRVEPARSPEPSQ